MASDARFIRNIVITVLNCLLLVFGIVLTVLLVTGTAAAKKGGTFTVGEYSFYLNKSEGITDEIEKNDLVVVKKGDVTSFKIGDTVAFFYDYSGERKLTLKKFAGVVETEILVTDTLGETYTIPSADTEFAGTVTLHSRFLGNAVRFLQTDDGKVIFLWWCGGLTVFAIGLNLLSFVIDKNLTKKSSSLPEEEEISLELEE